MDKDISTLLREIQDIGGLTQPQLADKIGASQATVSRIINGQADCLGRTHRAIADLHKKTVSKGAIPAPRSVIDMGLPHPPPRRKPSAKTVMETGVEQTDPNCVAPNPK